MRRRLRRTGWTWATLWARWDELETISRKLSAGGRSVSPAQLAALLVERQLVELEREMGEGGEEALRRTG